MVILGSGILVGLLVMAVVVSAAFRPVACGAAGAALLILVAAGLAALPAQTLCLADASPAPAGWFIGAMALCAAVGGGAIGWGARPPAALVDGKLSPERVRLILELSILLVCLVLSLVGALLGQITLPRAVLLGPFVGAAIVAAIELRQALVSGMPEMRSSWGGLGGGLGGWEISRQTVLLLAVLIFAGCAVACATGPSPEATPANAMAYARVGPC